MRHIDIFSGFAIAILKNRFLIEYDIYNKKSSYLGYDDENKMIHDFIMYYNDGVTQSWWCDGIQKHMLKTKIEVYEIFEYEFD